MAAYQAEKQLIAYEIKTFDIFSDYNKRHTQRFSCLNHYYITDY